MGQKKLIKKSVLSILLQLYLSTHFIFFVVFLSSAGMTDHSALMQAGCFLFLLVALCTLLYHLISFISALDFY